MNLAPRVGVWISAAQVRHHVIHVSLRLRGRDAWLQPTDRAQPMRAARFHPCRVGVHRGVNRPQHAQRIAKAGRHDSNADVRLSIELKSLSDYVRLATEIRFPNGIAQ
jgi:hypothetical protein